jgi:peptide chain release factor 1
LFEKLAEVERKYEELTERLGDPAIVSDPSEYQRAAKAHAELTELINKWREYQSVKKQIEDTEAMLDDRLDAELRDLAQSELDELKERVPKLEQELKILLLPKDPNDEKNVLVEIRAGTGGEEAALFAGDLVRMYTRYAERRGWRVEMMSATPTGIGGYKEAILEVKGDKAYSQLKFEGGVHRVQRVPETESGGRLHTSAATVAVMPEAEEIDVQINQDDLHIDTYRSASAGGQNVQKNDTAVRIHHKPSGIVVQCQDERSQLQNKERAMAMLRTHLYNRMMEEQQKEQVAARRLMVMSGDRSDKIRTYNYPQNRITDHRINFTIYNLNAFMDGDIQEMIDRLVSVDQAERLKESLEGANGNNIR